MNYHTELHLLILTIRHSAADVEGLTYREEDIFLILVDSARIWDYVCVLDDRYRFSSEDSLICSQCSRVYLSQSDVSGHLVSNCTIHENTGRVTQYKHKYSKSIVRQVVRSTRHVTVVLVVGELGRPG